MRFTTSGERLFFLIKGSIIPDLGKAGSWDFLSHALESMSGNAGLFHYVRGALAIHAARRLIRLWQHELETPILEHLRVRRAVRLATSEVFPGLDDYSAQRLGRALVQAVDATDRRIPPSIRKAILGKSRYYRCYLCNFGLDARAPEGDEAFATLEHLWPSSIGGESVEENLLPACCSCQGAKEDALSWEWTNVHNVVLPAAASDDCLKAIRWSTRIARHYMHVIAYCHENGCSLKNGFQNVGPISTPLRHDCLHRPVSFFDLTTV